MCGITGFIDFSNSTNNNSIIRSMTNSLKHRGPDDFNIYTNQQQGIYLGHTRLSIIDLSESGNQPIRPQLLRERRQWQDKPGNSRIHQQSQHPKHHQKGWRRWLPDDDSGEDGSV